MHRRLSATSTNWLIDRPEGLFRASVKIRYNDSGHPALVMHAGDDVRVEFDEPVAAITPGQLAVFYIDAERTRRVAGAGWIDRVED
jgi:tRNA-specific 2-thiouridylase